jgi:hypothetical protein
MIKILLYVLLCVFGLSLRNKADLRILGYSTSQKGARLIGALLASLLPFELVLQGLGGLAARVDVALEWMRFSLPLVVCLTICFVLHRERQRAVDSAPASE